MTHFTMRPAFASALVAWAALSRGAEPPAPPTRQWDSGSFSLVPRSLQKNPDIDVIIITESTPAWKAAPAPSPGIPPTTWQAIRD